MNERRILAAQLRAEGLLLHEIGQRLGVSKERARQLLLPKNPAKDPAKRRAKYLPVPPRETQCPECGETHLATGNETLCSDECAKTRQLRQSREAKRQYRSVLPRRPKGRPKK